LKFPRIKPLRAAFSLSVLALVALLAGCGGGGKDPQEALNDAFSTPIESANVTLSMKISAEGVPQLEEPAEVKLSGPFQSNGKEKLPSLDWQASVSGAGQSFSGGLVSTGDNAFVNFQGSDYEVGEDQVAQLNQQLGQQTQDKSLKDFGIDPNNWVTNAEDEGSEEVNGADSQHVSAGVDVEKMLADLNKTVEQAGAMSGGAAPQQITPEQIEQIKQVVKEPKIDVWVGSDDDILRRLTVVVDFEIPEAQRAQFNGASGGKLEFSLDLAEVNEEQTIEAPANPKPLSELQGSLGGLGGGGSTPTPDPGASGDSGSGSGGSGSGGSGATAEDFEKYSKCIEQADPSNTAEIQKCSELLK
jgi:hypothetical protein